MNGRLKKVLFLCMADSARSIMAECTINREGIGKFRGFSAGSQPRGEIHEEALRLLAKLNHDVSGLRSINWQEFAVTGVPLMDFVFPVCGSAAEQVCPIWPGQPTTAHWDRPEPAAASGSEAALAFADAYRLLTNRISICANPALDKLTLRTKLDEIGRSQSTDAVQEPA